MKKTKKISMKETHLSQKPITSFFNTQPKKHHEKEPITTSVQETIELSDDDSVGIPSFKKVKNKLDDCSGKLTSSASNKDSGKRKFVLQKLTMVKKMSPPLLEKKNKKKMKMSTDKELLRTDVNVINLLTKGKHYNDDQQRVPQQNAEKQYDDNNDMPTFDGEKYKNYNVNIYTSPDKKPGHSGQSPHSKKNLSTLNPISVDPLPKKNILSPSDKHTQANLNSPSVRQLKVLTEIGIENSNNIMNKAQGNNEIKASTCKKLFDDDLSEQLVPEINDMFEVDFNEAASLVKVHKESLNLMVWQRCKVLSVSRNKAFEITIKVSSFDGQAEADCLLKENWRELNILEHDIVSIIAHHINEVGVHVVDNKGGLVVQWPDTLVSGTSVVGSLFCKRKSVLQEHFRGIDCNNKIMTIGSLTHELFQRVLEKKCTRESEVRSECEQMLGKIDSVYMLYGAELSHAEAKITMFKFVPQIVDFVNRFVSTKANMQTISSLPKTGFNVQNEDWTGKIDDIVDIEENIWSPHLGLKGKVDVTCEVTIHSKTGRVKRLLPLELKTGKASLSAEHRGQVILYTMMMSTLHNMQSQKTNVKIGEDVTEGLLLYLRDKISIREIKAGHPEKRDLIMLRNQLAYYFSRNFKEKKFHHKAIDSQDSVGRVTSREQLCKDLEEMGDLELPEPINHHSACNDCAYLTLCSLYLRRDKNVYLNDRHPLKRLEEQAVGHLTDKHVEYFIKWVTLLAIEETDRPAAHHLKDLWTVPPSEREMKGKCLANLVIKGSVRRLESRFLHSFTKSKDTHTMRHSQLQSGEYVIVSSNWQYAIASGVIQDINDDSITVLLERNLTLRNAISEEKKLFCIDASSSSSALVFNLTNLGLLMDNTERSAGLRRIIIDGVPPTFMPKLSQRAADLGRPLLANLNTLQQNAVLKSIAAKDYLLIRGMPGTGKSQTCACLIELLVLRGESVLITSHTHSAVDNLMMRLINKDLKMLRIGSKDRIHHRLHEYSESYLTSSCNTPDELNKLFTEVDVVGVTCLGAGHALLSKRQFSVCLVDESAQVLQCCVLRPLFAAKKFILVGDPDQLPPLVKSDLARCAGMENSLFLDLERFESSCISLSCQYRMNRKICELANRLTYRHKLTCANEAVANGSLHYEKSGMKSTVHEWLNKCVSPEQEHSVLFLNTGSTYDHCRELESLKLDQGASNLTCDRSNLKVECSNIAEVVIVLRIIQEFHKLGVQSERIGIITPYRSQVALLKMKVEKFSRSINVQSVEVNTVDQFQGRDKDVILYSCAKTLDKMTSKKYRVQDKEILQDHRRLTVAVTRAKYKLILIGDAAVLSLYKPFKLLLDSLAQSREDGVNFDPGCVTSLPELRGKQRFSYKVLLEDLVDIM